ncbi:MAG: hypothetical protein JWP03_797 [Phycisphaerales bacterium]|jgi:hypothetical protein|nr:hypothetical protein [Phycisphaerales bacterium]
MAKFLTRTGGADGSIRLSFDMMPLPGEVFETCKRLGIDLLARGFNVDGNAELFYPEMGGEKPVAHHALPAFVIIGPLTKPGRLITHPTRFPFA